MTLTVLPGFAAGGLPDAQVARRVASAWLAGGLVGLPTETVYGLAADAERPDAVARVFRAKGRPADHPLIVHVAGVEAIAGWAAGEQRSALRLAEACWPGPLTVIVRRGPRASDLITGRQATVALRCPAHPVARACLAALAEASGDPARGVAAPSANRFGRVSPTSAADVVAELGDRLDPGRDLVVDGGRCAVGVESTIVDCTGEAARVLRLGAVSQEQVDAVLGMAVGPRGGDGQVVGAEADQVATRAGEAGADAQVVRAPGTLDSHYAPRARVLLVEPMASGLPPEALEALAPVPAGLLAPAPVATPAGWVRLAAPASMPEYARELYAALRRADELGLGCVLAVLPDPQGGPLAEAVRDRLRRAAHRG